MADAILNDLEARNWLRGHIERAGGLSKFCQRAQVSKPLVSAMQNGKKPITGKVARMIGLAKVNYYELTKVVASPEQERYENARAEYREQNPLISKEVIDDRDRAVLAKEAAKKQEPPPEPAEHFAVSVFDKPKGP